MGEEPELDFGHAGFAGRPNRGEVEGCSQVLLFSQW